MIETQHRRLHYLASRRGSKELEIILTRLLKNVLASNPSTNLLIVLENFLRQEDEEIIDHYKAGTAPLPLSTFF